MRLVRYTYPATLTPAVRTFARSPWTSLESEIDRMFDTALNGLLEPASAAGFPVDVYEDKDNTYVRAEMPGVNREDINVAMADGYLTLSATRKKPASGTKEEEETLSFSRSISIHDEVDTDKVAAVYENGVLTVTLPKREEAKPRKITINVK